MLHLNLTVSHTRIAVQTYMATVREAFPDTRFFALRTDSHIRVAPRRDEPKRWTWLNHPNTNAYISQMNAVLRHVAASEDLPLVDFEHIAMQLPQARVVHHEPDTCRNRRYFSEACTCHCCRSVQREKAASWRVFYSSAGVKKQRRQLHGVIIRPSMLCMCKPSVPKESRYTRERSRCPATSTLNLDPYWLS